MTAFPGKAMPDPVRLTARRPAIAPARPFAALLFVLVAPLFAGCGGAATADYKSLERPAPPPAGFMRVGDVTREAEAQTAATATAAATAAPTADPAAPPPPPSGGASDSGASRPPNEKKASDEANKKPLFTAAAGGSSPKASGKNEGSHVQGAVVDSTSGLSEAEVRSTIVQQQAAFQPCYEIGVQSSSGSFSGIVTLRATIGPTGTVASVDVVSSSTKNVRVDGCAADAVRRIQFPAKGGGAVVAIPIEFGR